MSIWNVLLPVLLYVNSGKDGTAGFELRTKDEVIKSTGYNEVMSDWEKSGNVMYFHVTGRKWTRDGGFDDTSFIVPASEIRTYREWTR